MTQPTPPPITPVPTHHNELDAILRESVPFRFLTPDQRAALIGHAEVLTFEPGELVVAQGQAGDRRVFILLEGRAHATERVGLSTVFLSEIEAGRFFGERSALFGIPRPFEVRAATRVRAAVVEGEHFLALLPASPSFAQSLGNLLRAKQGLFLTFERFLAELMHGINQNHVHLRALLPHYLALAPALHRGANDDDHIDGDALMYAVRRLPDNITRTLALFLTDDMPALYGAPELGLRAVRTAARRRTIIELIPGKSMVVLRDGLSDLIDFVTCLCVFVVEAQKIRHRIGEPAALAALAAHVRAPMQHPPPALPFSAAERSRLEDIWGEALPQRLHDIALHHEDFGIEVTKQVESVNTRHGERWTEQIAHATRALLGVAPSEIAEDREVHIISSNTHSVRNCLNPALLRLKDRVLAWGREHRPDLARAHWSDDHDLLYATTRDFLRAFPDEDARLQREERASGRLRLDETALTGIVVELIDTARLRGQALDPGVGVVPEDHNALIVNIDYAFGQQAEEILANLLMLFGARVRSVNILGKAGSLTGQRGDLMVPPAFIEQTSDLLHELPRPQAIDLERLRRRAPDRQLHEGPLLTVAGTLLQNNTLLHFYRRVWQCVGLEMEGGYYLRQLLKAQRLGVTRRDVELRFLYYVSDVPLDHSANLSGPLTAPEGIPPLYAATREVLHGVFHGA